MKICGFIQVCNELRKGNLLRCLNNIWKYCDYVVAYDDGSTDGSDVALEKRGCDVLRGRKNDFINETTHKQKLLEFALKKHSDIDWFFWLDADEVLDADGTKNLKSFCRNAEADGYLFNEITLWRSDCWARRDYLGYGKFLRLWRNSGDLKFEIRTELHANQFPQGIRRIDGSRFSVIHYGYATKRAIVERWIERTSLGVPISIRARCVDESGMVLERIPDSVFPEGCEPKRKKKPTPVKYPEIDSAVIR